MHGQRNIKLKNSNVLLGNSQQYKITGMVAIRIHQLYNNFSLLSNTYCLNVQCNLKRPRKL